MYATRLLSMYKRNPTALSDPPPSGPNSSYLVILDEEVQSYSCFGLCKDNRIKDFPLPQNKNLTINYSVGVNTDTTSETTRSEEAMFIPVLNQPLSSNRYYVIRRKGKNQGQASTSSKEEDMTTCLCCSFVHDVKPRPLDPFNDYQQIEIIKRGYGFRAKSVASDGIPPGLLREKGWKLDASTPRNYHLGQALGSNDSLRSKLPDFNFALSNDRSESVVVGKWYCPFMFVKEEMKLKEQMKISVFYELTLEQRWEEIFSKENSGEGGVLVGVDIQTEVVKVAGKDAVWDEKRLVDGVVWFKSGEDVGEEMSVGLSLEVVKGMKWEQERFGWVSGKGKQVTVTKFEEFGGANKWKKFSCYVLVESFSLRRMDKRSVLTYDFKHSHQIRSKWE
ncbi:uncharacterized protein LOC127119410 [Lathyrus oleraceus]|uniref:DUF1262 family protein n=1 Tax=Pisum sativum TaxID=3888 RepID=A0A9D5BBQ9_PEA|nr:uncharacterized protein LOC127119410 [Pisum sativum]KAI5437196.1 hypothetical protein KIW84_023353 [Pisum sativum]KAI5437197.1 hypothetical protein KIW84_023353 [Pisum sativum]